MSVELRGLDGSNPMGLLAALGVLAGGEGRWRLGWRDDGTWRPYLEGGVSEGEVVEVLAQDRVRWGQDSFLTQVQADDIKMPGREFRALAEGLLDDPCAPWLGVLGNELVCDGSGKNIKPSMLHFGTGNQKLLSAAREIQAWATPGRSFEQQLEQALFGSWLRRDRVKSLSWDSSVSRDYALRLKDPSASSEKKLTEAGGEWLAFRGLEAFASAPRHGKLRTACVGGSWKFGRFRWPLWRKAASFADAKALLSERRIAGLSPAQAQVRGIFAVFVSQISRPNKYGTFSPSRPATSKDDPT